MNRFLFICMQMKHHYIVILSSWSFSRSTASPSTYDRESHLNCWERSHRLFTVLLSRWTSCDNCDGHSCFKYPNDAVMCETANLWHVERFSCRHSLWLGVLIAISKTHEHDGRAIDTKIVAILCCHNYMYRPTTWILTEQAVFIFAKKTRAT